MTKDNKITLENCTLIDFGEFSILGGEYGDNQFLCLVTLGGFIGLKEDEFLDLLRFSNITPQQVSNEGLNYVINLKQIIDLHRFIENSIPPHRQTDVQARYILGMVKINDAFQTHDKKRLQLLKEFKRVASERGFYKSYTDDRDRLIAKYLEGVSSFENASLLFLKCKNLYIKMVLMDSVNEEVFFYIIRYTFAKDDVLTDISYFRKTIDELEIAVLLANGKDSYLKEKT